MSIAIPTSTTTSTARRPRPRFRTARTTDKPAIAVQAIALKAQAAEDREAGRTIRSIARARRIATRRPRIGWDKVINHDRRPRRATSIEGVPKPAALIWRATAGTRG